MSSGCTVIFLPKDSTHTATPDPDHLLKAPPRGDSVSHTATHGHEWQLSHVSGTRIADHLKGHKPQLDDFPTDTGRLPLRAQQTPVSQRPGCCAQTQGHPRVSSLCSRGYSGLPGTPSGWLCREGGPKCPCPRVTLDTTWLWPVLPQSAVKHPQEDLEQASCAGPPLCPQAWGHEARMSASSQGRPCRHTAWQPAGKGSPAANDIGIVQFTPTLDPKGTPCTDTCYRTRRESSTSRAGTLTPPSASLMPSSWPHTLRSHLAQLRGPEPTCPGLV